MFIPIVMIAIAISCVIGAVKMASESF